MIEHVTHNNLILAIIVRSNYKMKGIEFFTPDHFSQQLGYMNRPKNYVIPPHTHNTVERDVLTTQEVLFIKSGVIRVDFYTDEREYLKSSILKAKDVVLLAHGGHGFEMLEDSEVIEVKQGPYAGVEDKLVFDPIDPEKVILSE